MTRVAALVVCSILALLAGCPQGSAPEVDQLAAIKARGKLVVAFDPTYPPFETTLEDGSIAGFDVDLAREVAKDLGVALDPQPREWDAIVAELRTGKVDAIFSGMSVTEERKQAVLFSEPYYAVGQVVLKRKGDERFRSWKDLDGEHVTVATQLGTTGANATRRLLPKALVKEFSNVKEAVQAMVQGQADAVVFDHPALQEIALRQAEHVEGLWEPFTTEDIAAAVRKDDPELKQAIDRTLARLQAEGRLAELVAKWFPRPAGAPVEGGR